MLGLVLLAVRTSSAKDLELCSLSVRARAAFRGMDVTAVPAETVISGQVDDDGVQQVLALIQSLGLKIVSVRRANGARKAHEHLLRPPD